MKNRRNLQIGMAAVLVLALIVALGWDKASVAQSSLKLSDNVKKTKAGFEDLLARYGDKSMLLAVTVRVAGPKIDEVEHIGRLAKATDSFLAIKPQNQRDLVVIPWEHILWVVGRPSG